LGRPNQVIDPTDPAVTSLTELSCRARGITSLTGIQSLLGLTDLDLTYNAISDPAPLTELVRLNRLLLAENPLGGDATWVAALTALMELDLGHTGLSDLTPLAALADLERLAIGNNGLDFVSPAGPPPGGGSANTLTDLEPLAGLESLRDLDLYALTGVDLAPLAQMAALTLLQASGVGAVDLSPLAPLRRLESLALGLNYDLTDIGPLASLSGLVYLDLTNCDISDISVLAHMPSLQQVWASFNRIADLRPLTGLDKISELQVGHNQILSIDPLASLTGLEDLGAGFNQISDISPLAGLASLRRLTLPQNEVADVSPLAGLANLESLSLMDNEISDISSLGSMPNLRSLEVDGNHVADVSVMAGAPKLARLSATGQRLSFLPAPAGTWLTNPVTFLDGSHLDLEVISADRVMGPANSTYCLNRTGEHRGGFVFSVEAVAAGQVDVSLSGYWSQTATEPANGAPPCTGGTPQPPVPDDPGTGDGPGKLAYGGPDHAAAPLGGAAASLILLGFACLVASRRLRTVVEQRA
jgi:Leucine-rich repeat (LRR) protein